MSTFLPFRSAPCLAAACATGLAQESWSTSSGPTGEEWSRMGTDGTDLYFTTGSRGLFRYGLPASAPTSGAWT